MPRIPGTEQSKYRLLLLSLALLANLSICNQAELNQKKKLKTTRKETLHILEIVVGETIREKNKIPIQKWWWSTSGSVARTRSLCRRSSSGGGSMNAASEAVKPCPPRKEGKLPALEADNWLFFGNCSCCNKYPEQRRRGNELIFGEFYNDFAAVSEGKVCWRYYIHVLLKLCNCKTVGTTLQRNLC